MTDGLREAPEPIPASRGPISMTNWRHAAPRQRVSVGTQTPQAGEDHAGGMDLNEQSCVSIYHRLWILFYATGSSTPRIFAPLQGNTLNYRRCDGAVETPRLDRTVAGKHAP